MDFNRQISIMYANVLLALLANSSPPSQTTNNDLCLLTRDGQN